MRSVVTGGTCTAAVLAFGIAALAQTASQPPTQPPTEPTTQAPQAGEKAEQVTLTGCVQKEADYRRAKDAGAGGAAGTGVGTGNEFVLVNASKSAAGSAASGAAGTATGAQTGTAGTSGSMAQGIAYEVTGSGEGQLSQYVGKRVEVIAKLKQEGPTARTGAGTGTTGGATTGTGTGTTGGTTARPPSGGVDPMGQDLNIPEIEVISVKEASGSCPASAK